MLDPLLPQRAEGPYHRCMDRCGKRVLPVRNLFDVWGGRQRTVVVQYCVGELKDSRVWASVVFPAQIELGDLDILSENIQPARIDIIPVIKDPLFWIGKAEHVRDLSQSANDPPLVVVGVLELVDDDHRKPIGNELAQRRASLQ